MAIHCLVPAYGLALIGDAALGHAPMTWAGWLPHALGLGGRFLAIYGGAGLGLTLLAALADRIQGQPMAPEEDAASVADTSRLGLARALADARGRFGARADALIQGAGGLRLDHGDSQTREIARDIQRLLDAGRAALDAGVADRDGLCTRTIAALDTLMRALDQKSRESALLAADEVHTLVNYVTIKYDGKID